MNTIMPTMQDRRNGGLLALIPYWPVIFFCVTCLTGLGGILVKLDYIQKSIEKTDVQFSNINVQMGNFNDRQNLTSQALIEIRGVNNQQATDLTRIETQLSKVQSDVNNIQKGMRWAPK